MRRSTTAEVSTACPGSDGSSEGEAFAAFRQKLFEQSSAASMMISSARKNGPIEAAGGVCVRRVDPQDPRISVRQPAARPVQQNGEFRFTLVAGLLPSFPNVGDGQPTVEKTVPADT